VSAALGAVALDRAVVEAPDVLPSVRAAPTRSMALAELRVAGDAVEGAIAIDAPGMHVDADAGDGLLLVVVEPRGATVEHRPPAAGATAIPFVVTGPGVAAATALTLDVTVRLCDDRMCYPPRTERVSGTIRRP
jgi:hypothetical protein